MARLIRLYNVWYNNGKYHSAIDGYPEELFSGKRDESWYSTFPKPLIWRRSYVCLRERMTNLCGLHELKTLVEKNEDT